MNTPRRSLSAMAMMAAMAIVPALQAQSGTPASSFQPPAAALPPHATAASPSSSEKSTKSAPDEDVTSIKLNTSHLVAEAPLSGGHYEDKEFVRDLVQLQWREGDPIDLYVIRPRGANNPPVVLYLYGFPSDTVRFRDDAYCRRVVAQGAAAVGFVSALTGPRFANRPMKEWFVSELQESLATSVHDTQMILDYLETRGDLDTTRVGFFGQGSGGAIAILSAAADTRIQALDLLSPWGDWPDWLAESRIISTEERPTFLKPDFLKKVEPLDPMRYLPELKDRKIRLQYVDDVPDLKAPVKMQSVAPSSATVVHYKTPAEFVFTNGGGRVFEWLATQLKATPNIAATPTAKPALDKQSK